MKNTVILRDEPASEDAFGAHRKIAEELVRIIQSSDEMPPPRSVGLLGDWGSGKSSVVYMMQKLLADSDRSAPRCHVFIYDAWAHQGDELRRAFLDTLVDSLNTVIKGEDKDNFKKRIWQREEKTETKSEQVLRRHGKILLVSLLLSPIFIRLYQSPPAQWDENLRCIWNYVSFFGIFSPFIAFLLLQLVKVAPLSFAHRIFFATNNKEQVRDIRISSVFFQRTEGQIDIKTTTNPADSISAFNNIFRDICERAIDSGIRVVFVIDNIDRLDHEDARSFWSTMQSFLDRSLWRRPNDARSVFYIVPFSPLAIRSVFSTRDGGEAASQSFIDKTFDLSVHVSPPIQVDLRGYMFALLRSAFPDHQIGCLEAVRDIYDYHRSADGALGRAGDAEVTRRTPRQMKLFANQLVGLYRLRGEDLALETMAAYLLCQRQINDKGLAPAEQLTSQQRYLLPSEPDVIQQMAAVHFGVSLSSAAQVVLFEPIREALSGEDPGALKRLSDRSGFPDVLKLAIGTRDGEATVLEALRVAVVAEGLPGSDSPKYNQIWNALLNNIRHAKRLGPVGEKSIDGLRLIFQHIHETERAGFKATLQLGLSARWSSLSDQRPQKDNETDEVFEQRMAIAGSLATCLQGIADLKLLDELGEIVFTTYAGFATRLVDAIARIPAWQEVAGHLKLNVFSGDLSKAITSWPGIVEGPTSPYDFVKVATVVEGYSPDWSKTANLAIGQVASASVHSAEASASLMLAVSIATLVPKSGVDKAIQSLFLDAAFAAKFPEDSEDSLLSGTTVAAFLMFAPSTNPDTLLLATGRPATGLANLLNGNEIGSDIYDLATDAVLTTGKSTAAFVNSVFNPKAQKVGAEVVSRLIKKGHRFDLGKFNLVRAQNFISSLPGNVPVQNLYEQLRSANSVLKDLNKREIVESESYTYLRAINTSWGSKSIALKNRLKKYVQDASADKWVKTIQEQSDASNLMYTLNSLKRLGVEASLGAPASDAVTKVVEQAIAGDIRVTPRVAEVVAALEPDVLRNLSPKIWNLLVLANGPEPIASVVAVMPDVIRDNSSRPLTELLNTVLTRALSSTDASLLRWIGQVIREREKDIQKSLPAVGEFRSRVSAQLRTSGLSKEFRSELKQLLQIVPKPPVRRKASRKPSA